jgi:hypothetical protein
MSSTIEKECKVIILPSNKESILSVWGNEEYPMDELFLSTPQNRISFDVKYIIENMEEELNRLNKK